MKTLMITMAVSTLWAQEAGKPVENLVERLVELRKFEISHLVNGPVVKNAPYSAEAVTETVRVLSDGNRIEHRSSTKIFRDSVGRERREEDGQIYINDPMEHRNFVLGIDGRTAETRPGNTVLFSSGVNAKNFFVHSAGGAKIILNTSGDEPVEQDLGKRTIEGVEATGTRSTVTIPAGEIGNIRPIEIVDERWESPELHAIVYSRHTDPREGTTEYRLINISRGEQPRTLFDLPADVTVPESMKKGVIRMNVK